MEFGGIKEREIFLKSPFLTRVYNISFLQNYKHHE